MKTPAHKVFRLVYWSYLLFVVGSVLTSKLMVSFVFCFVIPVLKFLLMDRVRTVSLERDEMVDAPAWACSGGQSLFLSDAPARACSFGQSRFLVWCPCMGLFLWSVSVVIWCPCMGLFLWLVSVVVWCPCVGLCLLLCLVLRCHTQSLILTGFNMM